MTQLPNIYGPIPGQSLMELFFDTDKEIFNFWQDRPSFPPVDIFTTKDKDYLKLKFAVSGFSKEDITVEVKGDYIRITGKQKEETKDTGDLVYIKKTLNTSEFSKKFTLDTRLFDLQDTTVELKDGMLEITIPQSKTLVASKKIIEIK